MRNYVVFLRELRCCCDKYSDLLHIAVGPDYAQHNDIAHVKATLEYSPCNACDSNGHAKVRIAGDEKTQRAPEAACRVASTLTDSQARAWDDGTKLLVKTEWATHGLFKMLRSRHYEPSIIMSRAAPHSCWVTTGGLQRAKGHTPVRR